MNTLYVFVPGGLCGGLWSPSGAALVCMFF